MIIKNIYFDYYNEEKPNEPFGQITFHNEYDEKIDVINLDIPKQIFYIIYYMIKLFSPDKRYLEYKEW